MKLILHKSSRRVITNTHIDAIRVKMKKMRDTKSEQRCGATGSHGHGWWESKMVETLWILLGSIPLNRALFYPVGWQSHPRNTGSRNADTCSTEGMYNAIYHSPNWKRAAYTQDSSLPTQLDKRVAPYIILGNGTRHKGYTSVCFVESSKMRRQWVVLKVRVMGVFRGEGMRGL